MILSKKSFFPLFTALSCFLFMNSPAEVAASGDKDMVARVLGAKIDNDLNRITQSGFVGEVPKVKDLIDLRWPVEVALSPNGKALAIGFEIANWEKNRYDREIWVSVGGRKPVAFVKDQSSNYGLKWSPDGRAIFFLSDRTGRPQVYRIRLDGGEEQALTKIELGVSSFDVSQVGDWLALAMQDPEDDAFKKRRETYGDFEWVHEDFLMTHLWRLDAQTKKLTRITGGKDFSVDGFSISPDGKKIAFDARWAPSMISGNDSDIYVADVETRNVKKIVGLYGSDRNPLWSLDGKEIAFESSAGKGKATLNQLIAIVPATGGEVKFVTGGLDENPALLAWRKDGLYFSALQKTESYLFRVQPDGARLERLTGRMGWVCSDFSIAKGAEQAAFIGENFTTFAEVYISPLSSFAPEKLTDLDDQLSGFRLSQRELIRWKSKDGLDLDGILVKPPDFDPLKKQPLLFVIHGGPQGVDAQLKLSRRDARYYPIERFAARGALVLMVNYRGSAGYGEKFRTLNVRNLGVHDEWDFESAIDHLVKLGYVDPERVGTMGWSQGGFISAFLATHSKRFRAVSVGAGISDWATQYAIADMFWYEGQYHGSTTPWNDPEVFRKTAPISYVKGAKTPTLIQHGDKDPVGVTANSFELYRALKDNHVPVRFVLYKGFEHSINKPNGNLAVMTHNEEWFVKWIWDGQDPLKRD